MPRFIATYDLKETSPPPHDEFVAQARMRGWKRWITSDGKWRELPHTAMIGSFSDRDEAVRQFEAALSRTRTKITGITHIEKRYIAAIGDGSFVSDKSALSEPPP